MEISRCRDFDASCPPWVSVTDGEIRNLGRAQGPVNRPSPDGRFIASALSEDAVGKVWITPTSGGVPGLVSENAQLIDWTRDGLYLIVTSSHSGSEAVHLLPIKDGKAAGDPVFVRYGPCYFGSTVGNGGEFRAQTTGREVTMPNTQGSLN